METRRTILTTVLCLIVLLGYNLYLKQIQPEELPAESSTVSQAAQPAGSDAAATAQPQTVQATPPAQATASAPAPAPAPTNGAEVRKVSLSNELTTFHLTSWGARIESAELAQHMDQAGPQGKPLRMLPGGSDTVGITSLMVNAPRWDEMYELVSSTANKATFAWQSPDGLRIEKTYTLEPGQYDIALRGIPGVGCGKAVKS